MTVTRLLSASALVTLVSLATSVGGAQQPAPAVDTTKVGKQVGATKGPFELPAIQVLRNRQIGTA